MRSNSSREQARRPRTASSSRWLHADIQALSSVALDSLSRVHRELGLAGVPESSISKGSELQTRSTNEYEGRGSTGLDYGIPSLSRNCPLLRRYYPLSTTPLLLLSCYCAAAVLLLCCYCCGRVR